MAIRKHLSTILGFFLFSFFIVTLSFDSAFANSVKNSKNGKILVELTDLTLSVGDEIYVLNAAQKRVGLATVSQVKGQRAIAEITKGSAQIGYAIVPKSAPLNSAGAGTGATEYSEGTEARLETKSTSKGGFDPKKHNIGLLFSMNMNSMNAEETNGTTTETANMKGTSFGLYGYFDYAFSESFQARLAGSFDQFKASSSLNINGCDNRTSRDCNVNITYLSGFGAIKYNILPKNKFRPFLIGGMAVMMAMSKSTTALKESDIGLTTLYTFGGGVDIKVGSKGFIPVSFEYGIFPSSPTVSANMMILRAGYGWFF